MAALLEGKLISEQVRDILKQKIRMSGKRLKLACVQVGDNAVSEVYVKAQKRFAESIGIEYQEHSLPKETSQDKLCSFLATLNEDPAVTGIMLQTPLPLQLNYKAVVQYISPEKDIEGMHPVNLGKLILGRTKIFPATPSAVMELLHSIGIPYSGKEVVIVGHSEIVGKPLVLMLADKLATVTLCHVGTSKAGKLAEHVQRADVLIVAVGKPGLIKGEWIKEKAIVIDVGISKVADKIIGDVEFDEASKRASWITPVPGGVGPLTVAMLMRNLVEAARL